VPSPYISTQGADGHHFAIVKFIIGAGPHLSDRGSLALLSCVGYWDPVARVPTAGQLAVRILEGGGLKLECSTHLANFMLFTPGSKLCKRTRSALHILGQQIQVTSSSGRHVHLAWAAAVRRCTLAMRTRLAFIVE